MPSINLTSCDLDPRRRRRAVALGLGLLAVVAGCASRPLATGGEGGSVAITGTGGSVAITGTGGGAAITGTGGSAAINGTGGSIAATEMLDQNGHCVRPSVAASSACAAKYEDNVPMCPSAPALTFMAGAWRGTCGAHLVYEWAYAGPTVATTCYYDPVTKDLVGEVSCNDTPTACAGRASCTLSGTVDVAPGTIQLPCPVTALTTLCPFEPLDQNGYCVVADDVGFPCAPTYDGNVASCTEAERSYSGECPGALVFHSDFYYDAIDCYYDPSTRNLLGGRQCTDNPEYCGGRAFCRVKGTLPPSATTATAAGPTCGRSTLTALCPAPDAGTD